VTRFRLNAGRPAPSYRGGPSARPADRLDDVALEDIVPSGYVWRPNREPDTPLACGCSIPWPIVCLVGSASRTGAKQVQCDKHGWQHVAKKEIDRSERLVAATQNASLAQLMIDDPPPF